MSTRCYDTDLNDAAWAWVAPYLPEARTYGRPRTTDLRAVLNAIFYLLRTGCQWRLLPREFPRPGTVYHYFGAWKAAGVLAELQRALYAQARLSRGRLMCPSVVILEEPVGQDGSGANFLKCMFLSGERLCRFQAARTAAQISGAVVALPV